MKQNSGDNRCLAIVSALAFKTVPEEFEQFVNKKPPYTGADFCRFAFNKGALVGIGFTNDGQKITDDLVVTLNWKLKGNPAMIEVDTGGKYPHSIYWDGDMVWDPSPLKPNGMPLDSYQITGIFPITFHDNLASIQFKRHEHA